MNRRALCFGLPIVHTLAGACARAEPSPSLSSLALADGWLGARETAASLRGRAVLVDVFTFECVNCRNVTPNLKRLYRSYGRADLAVVAVHTPEVPSYQGGLGYLAREKRAAGLPWPIAIDTSYRIWNAYGVSAWPTQLVFDRHGKLVATVVGDGRDEETNDAVARAVRG